MINNLPEPNSFLKISANFYFESLASLVKLCPDTERLEYFFSPEYGFDDIEFCELNSIKVGNTALLIFSAIENYLKYKISQKSPLLLISNLAELKWKIMNFDEFYMHGFTDLLKLYAVIYESTENSNLKEEFEKLRIIRNKFVHSGNMTNITLEELIKVGAFFIINIWNKYLSEHGMIFKFFSEQIGALENYDDIANFVDVSETGNEEHKTLLLMYQLNSFFLNTNQTLSFIGLKKTEFRETCPVCSIYSWDLDFKDFRFSKIIQEGDNEYLYCHLCQAKVSTEN